MSFESVLALVLLLTGHAAAFWRMPCRYQTGLGRLDPIMDPGEISAHVHTITGGGGKHSHLAKQLGSESTS